MEWTQKHKYALKAGAYQVSKTFSAGKAVYTAWPPKPAYNKLNWRATLHACIGCYSTAAEAKAACEAHAATQALCNFACQLNHPNAPPTAA